MSSFCRRSLSASGCGVATNILANIVVNIVKYCQILSDILKYCAKSDSQLPVCIVSACSQSLQVGLVKAAQILFVSCKICYMCFFQKWISTKKDFLSQLETPWSELLRLNCLQKSCNLTGGQYEWIPRKPNCTIAESNKESCERKVCQRSLSLQWAVAKQAIHAATQLISEESLAGK